MIPKKFIEQMITDPTCDCEYHAMRGTCDDCFMRIHCVEIYLETFSHLNNHTFKDVYRIYRHPAAIHYYTEKYGADALFDLLL